MNMFGWTTYGWTHWGNPDWNGGPEQTEARVYKHHTGLVVAIPVDTEDPFLVLSQMNRYLEDLAVMQETDVTSGTFEAHASVAASLILGEATLFGKPITIKWPEGLPDEWGWPELEEFARRHRMAIKEPANPNPGVSSLEQLVEYMTNRFGALQHQHQWAIVGVDYPDDSGMHPRMQVQASQITNVALKCHCGMIHGLTLNGYWTMERLQMKIGEQVASQARSTTGQEPSQSDDGPTGEYPPTGP